MAEQRKQNIVAFLGAGVSKCLGIPLMAEFVDVLRDSQILSPTEQADFDRIQHQCGQMASIINGTTRNLEFLTSFLATLARIQPTFVFEGCKEHRTPQQALDLVLSCIWKLTSKGASDVHKMSQLLELAATQHFKLSIITTNYDLHVEYGVVSTRETELKRLDQYTSEILTLQATGDPKWTAPIQSLHRHIEESKSKIIPVFPGDSVIKNVRHSEQARMAYSSINGAIPLCKLHGSVNWFAGNEGMFVLDDIIHDQGKFNLKCAEVSKTTQRLIVPPSVLKPELTVIFEEQWRRAA